MKKADFAELSESIARAGTIRRGETKASRRFEIKPVDIKAIRARLALSQSEFALMLGVSAATLQNWEQGRRTPEGPARALLRVVEKKPEAVLEALAS